MSFSYKEDKTHIINFRVTQEEWKRLEIEARIRKISPHELARDRVQQRLKELSGMSFWERALYEELYYLRNLIASGNRLIANQQLTPEVWEEAKRNVDDRRIQFADELAQQSKLRNSIFGIENHHNRHSNGDHHNGHQKGNDEQ